MTDELSDLEKQFQQVNETVGKEIKEKLSAASKLVREAEKLSEQHGLPFRAGVSPLSQSYVPESFRSKWPDLDRDFAVDETGAWSEYGYDDYGGWAHSAVC